MLRLGLLGAWGSVALLGAGCASTPHRSATPAAAEGGPATSGIPTEGPAEASSKVVLRLDDVKANPTAYAWREFRPNLEKLILSGSAEGQHVALLWYTVRGGQVGLHLHAKTESVYVLDGSQADAQGVYPAGTVYFNPPGSGHAITDSSGFFLLAYASPPDFAHTGALRDYTPVRLDTADPALTERYPLQERGPGARAYPIPLEPGGGMSAELLELSPAAARVYRGNYVLVLQGRCTLDGEAVDPRTLSVAQAVEPQSFALGAAEGSRCVVLGVSF